MPLTKRKFFIPCAEDECFRLYELVKDRIPSVSYVTIEITSKGLLIEAYGHETDVKELWYEIRRIVGPLKEAMRKTGLKKYSISLITKTIHRTISPRILVEILKRSNYSARYVDDEDAIYTNALFEDIVNYARRIASLSEEVGKYATTTSTRYYIVTACALTNLPIGDVAKMSIKLGLIKQINDSKFVLNKDWRSALDLFLKHAFNTSS
ncbi:MAG: DUF2067 domain-containing protein [Desulfurococcaceae archaeon]